MVAAKKPMPPTGAASIGFGFVGKRSKLKRPLPTEESIRSSGTPHGSLPASFPPIIGNLEPTSVRGPVFVARAS
eukprot:1624176-Amphidinium_carterae.1